MKRNAIVRIILWSIVLVVLLALLLAALYIPRISMRNLRNDPEPESVAAAPLPQASGKTESSVNAAATAGEPGNASDFFSLDAESIREIEIEWAAGTITVLPKDITDIRIAEVDPRREAEPMVWNVRDGKLAIQYAKNKKHSFGVNIKLDEISKDLIIEVPAKWQCRSLEIETATASLVVNDMAIREMDFDGASGTCVFSNCSVDQMDVNTASGDVRFQGSLQQLDCDAASANIILELTNVPGSIDLDTASGDLDVTLPADAGFTVTLEALSSQFQSDFETTQRNKSYIAGDGLCRIDVDAMSGGVTVRKGK